MINVAQFNTDFGHIMNDWPEEKLSRGGLEVRVLVDESSFSKRLGDGAISSDLGGAVFIKRDELTFSLEAKDLVVVRGVTYKIARILNAPDRVHLRVELQVPGK